MAARIGIDLGTTNSVVSFIRAGRPEVVAFKPYSRNTVPSVVQERDGELLVGDDAKENMPLYPEDTIWSIKRFMGRSPGDPDLEKARRLVPYRVEDPPPGKADLVVTLAGKQLTPVDISAYIVKKLVDDAADVLGTRPTEAVITVPAYFSERQIEATKRAGRQAGLNVRRILDEPTAAALAYGLDLGSDTDRTILVFDLGGGTFDVSILMLTGGQFTTMTIAGDNFLGGDDFDNVLLEHFLEIIEKAGAVGARNDKNARAHLKKIAEQAKIAMSTTNVHRVDQFLQLDPEKPPIRLSTKVERQWFDEKTKHLVDRAIEQVHIALKKAGMDASEIQNVVMVGGSTGIPAVQNAVQRVFDPKVVSNGLNPMLCVAQGAAILAESIGEGRELEVVQCCTSKPRGIELSDGVFDAILPAQTYYPMESPEWRRYKTTGRSQKQLRIAVYEGEKRVARDNEWQGDVLIDFNDGLPENTPVRVGVRLDNSGTTLLSVEVDGFPNAVKEAKVERIERKADTPEKKEDPSDQRVTPREVLQIFNRFLGECEPILHHFPSSKRILTDGLGKINKAIDVGNADAAAAEVMAKLDDLDPPVRLYFNGRAISRAGANMDRSDRLKKLLRDVEQALEVGNSSAATAAFQGIRQLVIEYFEEMDQAGAGGASIAGLRRA